MKTLHTLLLLFCSLSVFSQDIFEKGYFIDKQNNRTDCYINNLNWNNAPEEFQYRLSEDAPVKVIETNLLNEFKIENTNQYYKRFLLEVDNSLDKNRSDVSAQETLLKVLIEGGASLYVLESGLKEKMFFYAIGSGIPTQLSFKREEVGTTLRSHYLFREQLVKELNCGKERRDFSQTYYKEDDLVEVFTKYNACMGISQVNYFEQRQKPIFKFGVFGGTNLVNFNSSVDFLRKSYYQVYAGGVITSDVVDNQFTGEVESNSRLLVGLDLEAFFPYKNYKFSVFASPSISFNKLTIGSVNVERSKSSFNSSYNKKLEVDYIEPVNLTTLEIPLGLRYYFRLRNSGLLFIGGGYQFSTSLNKKADLLYVHFQPSNGSFTYYEPVYFQRIESSNSPLFQIGYTYNNKYNVTLHFVPQSKYRQKIKDSYFSEFSTNIVDSGSNIFFTLKYYIN